jgi:hypothetical protein
MAQSQRQERMQNPASRRGEGAREKGSSPGSRPRDLDEFMDEYGTEEEYIDEEQVEGEDDTGP